MISVRRDKRLVPDEDAPIARASQSGSPSARGATRRTFGAQRSAGQASGGRRVRSRGQLAHS